MGMFDWVKYKADCFLCGSEITEWQTKSAKDGEDLLRLLDPNDVEYDFYTSCEACGVWNAYDMSSGTPRLKGQEEQHDTYRVSDKERKKAEVIKQSRGEAAPTN